jgi:hypothetical protein
MALEVPYQSSKLEGLWPNEVIWVMQIKEKFSI